MNQEVLRVSPISLAKVSALIYLVLGVVMVPFLLLPALLGTGGEGALGVGFALFMPILYAGIGLVFGGFIAWLYNLIADRFGGILVELSSVAVVDDRDTDTDTEEW